VRQRSCLFGSQVLRCFVYMVEYMVFFGVRTEIGTCATTRSEPATKRSFKATVSGCVSATYHPHKSLASQFLCISERTMWEDLNSMYSDKMVFLDFLSVRVCTYSCCSELAAELSLTEPLFNSTSPFRSRNAESSSLSTLPQRRNIDSFHVARPKSNLC
jgi:hypothetical protein